MKTHAQQIGVVTVVIGHVVAVNAEGVERVLAVGDVVYADEVIRTADGGAITIQFNDGGWFDLGGNQQAVLDSDVFSPEGHHAEAVAGTARVQDIQAAIERGEDPTKLLPATAAGPAGGAGGEGGHDFVALDHDFVSINPEAGIPTAAAPLTYTNTFDVLPPLESPEPAIGVSVDVDVEVGGGEPGEGGVVLIPGGTPITGGVSGANVIEGSDGSSHAVTFLITLSQVSTQPVTVTYTIVPGTASTPDDYFDGAQTGTVTIPAGFIGFTVTENIVADILVESNETFKIVLSNPIGATLTNDTATVTIIDDDRAPVANDDTNWVQEDNFAGESENVTASGNVLQSIAHPGDPSPTLSFADAADNDDNPLILTWGAEAAQYGSITKNADGSYEYVLNNGNPVIQGLSAGETLTETFTYTITDGVNTPDSATLTITIFGKDDGVTITGIGSTRGDETVYENDLPAGSSPYDSELTQTGSFDIVALDGIATVTVGGTVLTLAQLQGLGTTPVVIDTTYGALTLTDYAGTAQGGTVSYSYTLDTTVDNSQPGANNDGFMESIGVTVTDEDGSLASSSVNIQILDDQPTVDVLPAVADGTSSTDSVAEDAVGLLAGTWTRAYGADTDTNGDGIVPATVKVTVAGDARVYDLGDEIDTGKGTLTVKVDGTWTFDPVGVSGSQDVVFTVTITDADGDTADDTHTITVTDGAGPSAPTDLALTVVEDGLLTVADTSESASGSKSFTLGSDHLASIVFSGAVGSITGGYNDGTITWVVSTDGHTLTGTVSTDPAASIVLNLTGIDLSTGAFTVDVTISDEFKHTAPLSGSDINNFVINNIAVLATDIDGDPATANVDVTVVDDVPTITVDNLAIPNVFGTYSGVLDFSVGADTQSFAASFGADSALSWTNVRDGFSFHYDPGLQTGTATFTDLSGTHTFFTVKLNADGTYDFNLVTPDPVTTKTNASLLEGITGGSNLSSYTIDETHFNGQFSLELLGFSGSPLKVDTLTISSTELGVGDNVMHGNKDDVLRFDVHQVNADSTLASLTVHVATTAGWKSTDTMDYTVHYTDGSAVSSSQVWGPDQEVTVVFDTHKTVDYFDITPDGTEAFKIDGVSATYTAQIFPDNYLLNFSVTGADADHDTASGTFSVAVNTTDTSTYVVTGTDQADTVYGTSGSDVLTGGAGSDTFVFHHADTGVDTITDFKVGTIASGGDVLDISDLLAGGNVQDHLVVTGDTGSLTTTIAFDADGVGTGAAAVQIATLQHVATDLTTLINNQQIHTT